MFQACARAGAATTNKTDKAPDQQVLTVQTGSNRKPLLPDNRN